MVARQQQAKSWELRASMSMARFWRDQGKRDGARDLPAPVYGWLTEGFDTRAWLATDLPRRPDRTGGDMAAPRCFLAEGAMTAREGKQRKGLIVEIELGVAYLAVETDD